MGLIWIGYGKIGDFQPISHRILEMVQNRASAIIDRQLKVLLALSSATKINDLEWP